MTQKTQTFKCYIAHEHINLAAVHQQHKRHREVHNSVTPFIELRARRHVEIVNHGSGPVNQSDHASNSCILSYQKIPTNRSLDHKPVFL